VPRGEDAIEFLKSRLKARMGSGDRGIAVAAAKPTVVLVVGKDQHVELVNQACFKFQWMEVKNQGRIIVLAEDEATAVLVRSLGYTRVLTHPALAAFRSVVADDDHGKEASLAWLHLVGAWLLVRKGYDALVHGPELVWQRHWSETVEGEGGVLDSWKHDVAFMAAAGSAIASSVTYVTPVVAVIVGVIFLGEGVTWYEPVGGLIVLLGAAIAQGRLKLNRS
jgi:hypothetical protein